MSGYRFNRDLIRESPSSYDKFVATFAIGVNRRNVYRDRRRYSWQFLDFNSEQVVVIYSEGVMADFQRPKVKIPLVVCFNGLDKRRFIPRVPVFV